MSTETQTQTVIDHVVCAFCGCVCDDLSVTVEAGQITGAKRACALGKAWLMSHAAELDRPAVDQSSRPPWKRPLNWRLAYCSNLTTR